MYLEQCMYQLYLRLRTADKEKNTPTFRSGVKLHCGIKILPRGDACDIDNKE